MEFKVVPYKSVGAIKFGMKSNDISNIIGRIPEHFRRDYKSKNFDDKYDGFYVYYDENGKCVAIEFYAPSKVIYNSINILESSYNELNTFFSEIDTELECTKAGFTSYKLGLGVYAPFAAVNPEYNPESVIVFQEGYYDD